MVSVACRGGGMIVTMFDTATYSDNLGDEIIMDSVWKIARELFPNASFAAVPTHRHASSAALWAGRMADLGVVGGTNILKARMFYNGNWRISPADLLAWRNVVLLGVGWRTYGNDADFATRLYLRTVLARDLLQSVRDQYTYEKLAKVLPNVIYTGCPTMWGLTPEHCAGIATHKAQAALFSVTCYHANPELDRTIFNLVKRRYERVYVWAQQTQDVEYIRALGLEGFIPVERRIEAFDHLLKTEDLDYIGSRLHGGIRALQFGRRALIFSVDNRAVEIAKSTELTVMGREEFARIENWIEAPMPIRLTLPWDNIQLWQRQFRETASAGLGLAHGALNG